MAVKICLSLHFFIAKVQYPKPITPYSLSVVKLPFIPKVLCRALSAVL